MPDPSASPWPWIALIGIGLFHGINPSMGWLFAVALGLHRNSRRAVLVSLVPIALGHAAAVAAVLGAILVLGLVVDGVWLTRVAAATLIGWALWHALYGHRRRVRVGMQASAAGLALWSFLMSSAHGAGLMLVPFLLPLCTAGASGRDVSGTALAALGLHTGVMLLTIGATALAVYHWIGVAFLRRGWINLDLVWIGALLCCGLLLLLA
jgi:hypothetical protein